MEDSLNIQISNASNEPIYLQIKNQIKGEIISGNLKAGEKLPSIRFLAKELRVSVITTKRAYDELELEGFINSVQGKGSFVSGQNKQLIKEEQYKKIESLIEEAIEEAKLVGLTKEDLIGIIESFEGE
jgi:GntR family transcriptional regulator